VIGRALFSFLVLTLMSTQSVQAVGTNSKSFSGKARYGAMGHLAAAWLYRGDVMADRDGTGTPLPEQTAVPRAAGLRWYIENIATDFFSSYHRYTPGSR